jgi:hypothetical protein
MRLGGTNPDLDAALLLSPEGWQAVYFRATKRPPKQAPQVNALILLIAGLGGLLGRKGEGEPGMQTLWLGLQRVRDFAESMRFVQDLHPPSRDVYKETSFGIDCHEHGASDDKSLISVIVRIVA